MMTHHGIVDIGGPMSIRIVLWSHKPSKQTYSNTHKQEFNTQHLKLIILTIKSLYVKITIAFIRIYIYTLNT